MNIPKIVISPAEWAIVHDILQRHVPGRKVWAFGSRAKWTSKEFSDLDLAIIGDEPLPITTLASLSEDFSESELPYKVDIVDWATTSPSFRKVIGKDKVLIFSSANKNAPATLTTEYGPMAAILKRSALGELCEKGGVQTGPFGSQLHKEDYVTDGVPIITVEHLGENRITHENLPRVSTNDYSRLSKYRLQTGDIVFSRVGSVDRRALVQPLEDGWLFSGRCLRVRPNTKQIDSTWLSYFFGLPAFKEYIRSIAVGATMPSLNTTILSEIPIYYPALKEQREVGKVLACIDDKIALLRETNTTLEAIAQALFKSWFVNFDPVRAKVEDREPEGIPPEIAALFPSEFEDYELGEIPKGWKVGTLADTCHLNPESWTNKSHPEYLCYVDLANTKNNRIEVTEYSFADAPSRARRILRDNDTIVGTVRPGNRSFAFIQNAPENLTGSTGFAVLRPQKLEYSEFVFFAATGNESIDRLAALADGGAYPAVRPEVVEQLAIVKPTDELMQAFHEITGVLMQRVSINNTEIDDLSALRDTLLPHLMSGKIHIPQSEAAS